MEKGPIIKKIRELATLIAGKDYQRFMRECEPGDVALDDLVRVIGEFGCMFVPPPVDAYTKVIAPRIDLTEYPTWILRAPLWTEEEGRSDLEMALRVSVRHDVVVVRLLDVLVP